MRGKKLKEKERKKPSEREGEGKPFERGDEKLHKRIKRK